MVLFTFREDKNRSLWLRECLPLVFLVATVGSYSRDTGAYEPQFAFGVGCFPNDSPPVASVSLRELLWVLLAFGVGLA